MENIFYIMVIGLGAFFYATFPVEKYSEWVHNTFGKWIGNK